MKCLEVVDAEVEQTDHEISALMEKIIVIVRARLAVPVYIIFVSITRHDKQLFI